MNTQALRRDRLTSKEKIEVALEQALHGDGSPTDEKTARLRQTLGMILPLVKRLGVIPDDPAEIDELLLNGARVALSLRSDGAELPETIEQLLNPPPAAISTEEIA